jgi:hypothetical protein
MMLLLLCMVLAFFIAGGHIGHMLDILSYEEDVGDILASTGLQQYVKTTEMDLIL